MTAFEMDGWLEFRRVLFRSLGRLLARLVLAELLLQLVAQLLQQGVGHVARPAVDLELGAGGLAAVLALDQIGRAPWRGRGCGRHGAGPRRQSRSPRPASPPA